MPYSDSGKETMLDALAAVVDDVSIHTGDPGAAGTDNEVTGNGYERLTPSWDPASGGSLNLAANLDFSGPANEDATWFGLWDATVFKGRGQITSGDVTFNAAGEFALTTDTELQINDS